MIKKIVGEVESGLTFSGINKKDFNEEVIIQENGVKNDIKSLINFSNYEEDIESFMAIDYNLNKYNKKTKRLDLTKLVFGIMKGMFKDFFLDYISHPGFKDLIFKVYGLKGKKSEYKINFNSEVGKESFIIINISDNRRYSGFSSTEVDGFIANKLGIRNNSEMTHFIKKVIYGIDDSFESFTGEGFKQFIYYYILKRINKLLEEKNDIEKIFLNGIMDKEVFVKAMAGKIYRDNFDYIHKIAGHKLMSDIPKLILDELLSNNSENLKKSINGNFKEVIDFISNFDSSNDSILDIEHKLNNDILINFQDKIKFYFKKFDETVIDPELLKGSIAFLIENNNLALNIKELSDSIFSLLENNIKDLAILFGKYNGKIIEENGKKYRYSEFKIRDFKNFGGKYSIEKILLAIKIIIEEINTLKNKIKLEEVELENSIIVNYKYKNNIGDKQKRLLEYDNKIDLLVLRREEITKELEELNNSGILNKVLGKNKLINQLKKEDNDIYNNLLVITKEYKELEIVIICSNNKVSDLNNSGINRKRKIEDLKLVYNNKNSALKRIREDFMRNILFGREQVK